jgi:hypothetical protein
LNRKIIKKKSKFNKTKKEYEKRFNQLLQDISNKNKTIHKLNERLRALEVPQITWPQGSGNWPIVSSLDLSGMQIQYRSLSSSWSRSVRIRTYLGEIGYLTLKCLSGTRGLPLYHAESFLVQLTQKDVICSGAFVGQAVYENNPKRYQKLGKLVYLREGSQLSLTGQGVVIDINLFYCSDFLGNGYSNILFHLSIQDK